MFDPYLKDRVAEPVARVKNVANGTVLFCLQIHSKWEIVFYWQSQQNTTAILTSPYLWRQDYITNSFCKKYAKNSDTVAKVVKFFLLLFFTKFAYLLRWFFFVTTHYV